MATPAPLFATVIHLETGHVLAAVSSGGLKPKLEDLTAKEPLRVRFPGTTDFVDVPIAQLKATRVSVTDDVLDRPQHYMLGDGLGDGNPPLTLGKAPVVKGSIVPGAEGKKAVVVWQDEPEPVAASGSLGAGGLLPGIPPPGATHQLLAYEGGPLYLTSLP